jgi:hypothetical protein
LAASNPRAKTHTRTAHQSHFPIHSAPNPISELNVLSNSHIENVFSSENH